MDQIRYPSNALKEIEDIKQRLLGKRLVVFLDYDGTLSPIVDIPDEAFMSEQMRDALRKVSHLYLTAIVTGRSTEKVQSFVQLDNLVYAGSHGFDIRGTNEFPISCSVADDYRPSIVQSIKRLEQLLAEIPGAQVEDNQFALSVHYRHVDKKLWEHVESLVDDHIRDHCPQLCKKHGKKVFELRPKLDWNKGRAVMWILSRLGLDLADVVPFYLGDDVSDEDAFAALRARESGDGIGIVIRDDLTTTPELPGYETEYPTTKACYSLRNTKEVEYFLKTLVQLQTASRSKPTPEIHLENPVPSETSDQTCSTSDTPSNELSA